MLDTKDVSKGTKSIFSKIFKLDKAEEEIIAPKEVYNYRIWLTAFVASSAALVVGYDNGFVGGTLALPGFMAEFGLDKMSESAASNVTSNIVSTFHAGCFFGSLFSYPLAYYLGRKNGLITASCFILVGSIIMMLASNTRGYSPILVGRVVSGLGVGVTTNLVPVYIAEVAPPSIRGQIGGIYEIVWRTGDLVGFWINYGISEHVKDYRAQWMIPFGMQLLPAVLFMTGSLVLKESPRWLFSVNQEEKAVKNMKWLRQIPENHEYFVYEVNKIVSSLKEEEVAVGLNFWAPVRKVFTSKKLMRRVFTTSMLFIFQSFMGVQSINYYSPKIFKSIGVKGTNATLFSTGIFGVVKYIATFVWVGFIVDNFGRRRTLMGTSFICQICFWYVGAYLKVDDPTKSSGDLSGSSEVGSKAAIGLMYVWLFFFIIGWSGTPYVYGAEVFDQNIRSFVQSINSTMLWLGVFIVSRFTNNMISSMNYGIWFFFAAVTVVTIPFVYFLVPETKGILLEDIDMLFTPNVSAHKAHKFVLHHVRERRNEFNDVTDSADRDNVSVVSEKVRQHYREGLERGLI